MSGDRFAQFSDRVKQYIENAVQVLAPLNVDKQNTKLKKIEQEVCSKSADPEKASQIVAAIREKLDSASSISGLSITQTMIDGPVTATTTQKRPLSPKKVSPKPAAAKKVKVTPPLAQADSLAGRPLSDGFIVDDNGEGTLIDAEDESDEESDEEVDPVFDPKTYTTKVFDPKTNKMKGIIDFRTMSREVKSEVERRQKERAAHLEQKYLSKHVLPEDDDEFCAIRAKHAQRQLEKNREDFKSLNAKLEKAETEAEMEILKDRILMLENEAAEQQKIIKRATAKK